MDKKIQNPVSEHKNNVHALNFFCNPKLIYLTLMNIKNLEEKVGRIIIKSHHLERQVNILDFDFKISYFRVAQLL
jgi:hypothetical protein